MRVKKQKRHRRAVRFYTTCFGFRQPFKVLCDGTFLYQLHANNISPADTAVSNLLGGTVKSADTAVSNLLGGTVKLFTTSCVVAELNRLNNECRKKGKIDNPYLECYNAARKLAIARCDHEKAINAAECYTNIIGDKNSDHFFVATQDNDLRKKFQQVPGVPIIFALRNALLMEQPSAYQRQFVKITEEQRSHMTEEEYKLLKKRIKKGLRTEEGGDTSDENEDSENESLDKSGSVVREKSQFRRKRAKGPNPLSCKKKQPRDQPKSTPQQEDKVSSTAPRSRSRKRKRSRGQTSVVEAATT